MNAMEVRDLLMLGVLGIVIALSGMLSDWLRISPSENDLPLWGFLARRGMRPQAARAALGEETMRLAEMRCAACGAQPACRKRLRWGKASPVDDCPNAALFP